MIRKEKENDSLVIREWTNNSLRNNDSLKEKIVEKSSIRVVPSITMPHFLLSDDSVVFKTIISLFPSISKGEFKISIFLANSAKPLSWVYIIVLSIDFSLYFSMSFSTSNSLRRVSF